MKEFVFCHSTSWCSSCSQGLMGRLDNTSLITALMTALKTLKQHEIQLDIQYFLALFQHI